jgi:hypothetical protein
MVSWRLAGINALLCAEGQSRAETPSQRIDASHPP